MGFPGEDPGSSGFVEDWNESGKDALTPTLEFLQKATNGKATEWA